MQLTSLLRLLVWTMVFFSTGLVTGWWLHDHSKPSPGNSQISQGGIPIIIQPDDFSTNKHYRENPLTNQDREFIDFRRSLTEGRNDDALVIFQHHEQQGSELSSQLRKELLNLLDVWENQKNHETAIKVLELFTQYYYQDTELLKKLADLYQVSDQPEKAVDVYADARSYSQQNVFQKDETDFFDRQIHALAKAQFEQKKKTQSLEALIPQFQKLAYLEPDYSFYHYALAEGYLSAGDVESAIHELQILQIDPEYGDGASRLLAKLLPPPPVEEPDVPTGVISLAGSGGHFIAGAIVGELFNTRLMIDTGATLTTLSSRVLQGLREKKKAFRIGHVELKTANGIRLSPLYRVKQFQIGNYALDNLEIVELEPGHPGTDGLLGMNVLGRFHFFIDQNQNTLSLSPR
ncbi:MAG: retroviral-like aspartic protease family protein [Endozoicomonas sp.]